MSAILVVDDHSVYRGGLRKLLETRFPHFHVGEASKLSRSDLNEGFNLILINSGNLSYATLELLAEWHKTRPSSRIAVLSNPRVRPKRCVICQLVFTAFYTNFSQRRSCLPLYAICSRDAYTFRAGLSTTMMTFHSVEMLSRKP